MSFLTKETELKLKQRYNYKDSSLKAIGGTIKRILKHTFNCHSPDLKKLEEFDKVRDYIEVISSPNVRKSLTNNVIKVLSIVDGVPKRIKDKYEILFKKYAQEHSDIVKYRIPTKTQQDQFITLEKIAQKRDTLRGKNTYNDRLKHVILSLYTYLPPLRGEDYYNTKVYRLSKDADLDHYAELFKANFIDLESNTLVISSYKTDKNYEIRKITIPQRLSLILEGWMYKNKTDQLLMNQKGNPVSGVYLTQILKRTIGLNTSTSKLRKIYISEVINYLSKRNDITQQQKINYRKHIAKIMAHSLGSQEFVYSGYRLCDDLAYSSDQHMKSVLELLDETM